MQERPLFIPTPSKIVQVPTTVPDLPIPPQPNLQRQPGPPTTTTTDRVLPMSQPTKLSGPPPTYPERAQERNIEGYATMRFTIKSDGTVSDVEVIEESPEGYQFASAAKRAFERWTFQPGTKDGKPVDSPGRTYRVTFKLK